MNNVTVKFKKLDSKAVLPKYAKDGDAGMDLTATSKNETNLYIEYGTGLAAEIPYGYVGLIFPRSSCSNYHMILSNSVGVVDSGYRGEIKFRFKKSTETFPTVYEVGDRIGQLIVMPYPLVLVEETDELEDSTRGNGGFGHTGR